MPTNLSYNYTSQISSKLNLSTAPHHKKYISRVTKIKVKRAIKIKTLLFKKNRILLKKKKSALRHKKETLKGTTYHSNSTLLQEPASLQVSSLSDEEGTLEENYYPIMFFDLGTAGLQSDCDILQTAVKCDNMTFNVYVNSKQEISDAASVVHGLRKFDGDLMLYNNKVESVPLRIAMGQLLSFLLQLNKKCYLAAHNLNFDGPRLFRSISLCTLVDDFSSIIEGFIDTLPIIRKVTNRTGKDSCTITSLANLLNISCANAHHATKDVAILEKIISKLNISYNDLVKYSISYEDTTHKWLDDERMRKLLPDLSLITKIVGLEVRKKLLRENITIDVLRSTYSNLGAEGVSELLNKKSHNRFIFSCSTKYRIINWLQENIK